MLEAYALSLAIRTGERFSADEMQVKVRGIGRYIFTIIDVATRFCLGYEVADRKDGHNATGLLNMAKKRAGKTPAELVTYGLSSYKEAYMGATPLEKSSAHISDACPGNKKRNNNVEERFNGTMGPFFRGRRGIKSADSPLFALFLVYYNFIRPHSSLRGRTPAEAAGITITPNTRKWRCMIGNAAMTYRTMGCGR